MLGIVVLLGLLPNRAMAEDSHDFELRAVEPGSLLFQRPRTGIEGVEGFIIDSEQLTSTLKTRVLEARELGSVAQVSRLGPGSGPPNPHRFEFDHRFAPPFSSVTVRLTLSPLQDPNDSALVDKLLLSLGLVVVLALYALYRMTATQLVFAERSRDFVSAVSHELKTPLTAIRMYGEMLAEDLVSDEEKRREYQRTIMTEGERLTRLIDNVLTLSRVERHHPLALRKGDVVPHVRDAVEFLRPHAQKEGCSLNLELDPALPSVWFEPDAIKQVIMNLVENSLKYGRDAGNKSVIVACRKAGRGVTISVRDYGPGVAPHLTRRIFLPFFRGERELTRKHPGTGIGLALVKSLTLAMKGRVSAENLDPGLRVTVELVGDGKREVGS
jgi:signal transduction histidine kinase